MKGSNLRLLDQGQPSYHWTNPEWSGEPDSNRRQPGPKPGTLAMLSYHQIVPLTGFEPAASRLMKALLYH
jgi:hypothetical protein